MKHLITLVKSEGGATAIEYAFLVTLVSLLCIIGMSILGVTVNTAFSSVASALAFANL